MPRSKETSCQQLRDLVVQQNWIERAGEDRIMSMENHLRNILGPWYKLKVLIKLVNDAATATNLKVERRAKRRFKALLAWFVINWQEIGSMLDDKARIYAYDSNDGSTEPQSITNGELHELQNSPTFEDTFNDSEKTYAQNHESNKKSTETQNVHTVESDDSKDVIQSEDNLFQFEFNEEEDIYQYD